MITRSDNNAASALWAKLGHSYLQHFLNLAGMKQTVLGPGGYWGLTQVTAHDETLLLRLLLTANTVLTGNSRAYALRLMAQVISSQRWGVPAGAPRSVTVHVKNGWLPRATHGWRINSIGGFTWSKGWYSIVVLSMDNPTMPYGITTVEAIARVIHRDLNRPRSRDRAVRPNPAWGGLRGGGGGGGGAGGGLGRGAGGARSAVDGRRRWAGAAWWFGRSATPVRAAAFDTRMHGPAALTGRAAKSVSRLLRQHGFNVVAEPESFLVTKQDRLEPQEQDRARDWGARLAASIV